MCKLTNSQFENESFENFHCFSQRKAYGYLLYVFSRKLSRIRFKKKKPFGGKGIFFSILLEITSLYKKMSLLSKDVDDK